MFVPENDGRRFFAALKLSAANETLADLHDYSKVIQDADTPLRKVRSEMAVIKL